MKATTIICLINILVLSFGHSQNVTVDLVNSVLKDLQGKNRNSEIPIYKSIEEVCLSDYFDCNSKNEIIAINMQFTNLTGFIPEDISELRHLNKIYLDYNYLQGTIPKEISRLKQLNELTLVGNFITGTIPKEIYKKEKFIYINLKSNAMSGYDEASENKCFIHDQINLDSCRSPDSIFIINNEANETFKNFESNGDSSYIAITEMPRFYGCEHIMDIANRDECCNSKFLSFIYTKLKYPNRAKENGTEGIVKIQFIINEDGNVTSAEIYEDIGDRCGNAALWVVNRMNYCNKKWIPGKRENKAINVLYTLPIHFKI